MCEREIVFRFGLGTRKTEVGVLVGALVEYRTVVGRGWLVAAWSVPHWEPSEASVICSGERCDGRICLGTGVA